MGVRTLPAGSDGGMIEHVPEGRERTGEVERVGRYAGGRYHTGADMVVVEEPLEIRFAGYSVSVTMRTPGDDFDLAAGFLYSEGIIGGEGDIASMHHCPTDDPDSHGNIVNVNPANPAVVDPSRWQRNFLATSSCGICGKASIDAVEAACRIHAPVSRDPLLTPSTLFRFADQLRQAQITFQQTGGLHAAALFDIAGPPAGRPPAIREDIGRHNAVDKVIGHALRHGRLPLHDSVLVVSSRASFEIVQKAAVVGIPVVAAVSAPSSMAIDLARSLGMTLVGFLRGEGRRHAEEPDGRFNVYAGEERIALPQAAGVGGQ